MWFCFAGFFCVCVDGWGEDVIVFLAGYTELRCFVVMLYRQRMQLVSIQAGPAQDQGLLCRPFWTSLLGGNVVSIYNLCGLEWSSCMTAHHHSYSNVQSHARTSPDPTVINPWTYIANYWNANLSYCVSMTLKLKLFSLCSVSKCNFQDTRHQPWCIPVTHHPIIKQKNSQKKEYT